MCYKLCMSNSISPEAATAAKWWADKLRGPNRMDAGSAHENDRDLGLAEVMMTVLGANENAARPAGDADKFQAALALYVQERLDGYGCTLSTDYGPDYELMTVADSCGVRLGMASLPIKTVMWVKRGSVSVSEGYGAPVVELQIARDTAEAA